MKPYLVLILFIFSVVLLSFQEATFKGFLKPVHFPRPVYDITKNPVTQSKFNLGRDLFYETALSRDNKISCGSCHIQSSAFTQHGHDISHGIEDRLGSRNSPPIMNLAWNKSFFWDGGVFNLDLQSISPITNPVEMDETMDNVLRKLRADHKYQQKFKSAFGSSEITGTRIFKALSSFMVMCISSDSKYDSVMRKTGVVFTTSEKSGYLLFKKNCAGCHQEPLFTDNSFRNNGLDHTYNNDSGRVAITLDTKDRFKFKVPSLRNLSQTAPFMHDGRFVSIGEVLDHYSDGIHDLGNLDPLLKITGKPGIPLSPYEKGKLKDFLKTLEDKTFLTRKDLSEHH